MSALRTFASLTIAALLGAGAAFAQNDAARDNAENTNPHSAKNKDRPAPGAATKAQTQSAESANPDSTLNKDRTLPADADSARDVEQAEKGNPHSVKNKDKEGMTGSMSMKDQDRMTEEGPVTAQGVLERMATADRGEVAMGKLAQENGSARLQQYGKMLEEDHGKSLGEVQELAKKKSLTLSATPKDMMAKHDLEEAQEMKGMLAKLHGAEFDKAFVKGMIEDHKKDIAGLKSWRLAASDKEVSALIEKTLPVLERHLTAAQSLRTPAAQGRTP